MTATSTPKLDIRSLLENGFNEEPSTPLVPKEEKLPADLTSGATGDD